MNTISSGGPQGTPVDGDSDAEVVLKLASINLAFGNQQRGLDLLYFAQWLSPENQNVLRKLTYVLIDMGDLDLASVELKKLTDTTDWSASVWRLIANFMKRSGRYDRARTAFKKAADLS